MTFLEAKKIVEDKGYHVVKNSEGESFRQRVAREELEEAMKVVKSAGLNVINENDLTNFAHLDSNGNINVSQDFEDDKMILSANFHDNTDDPDMTPYDAELTIQLKKKFRTVHHVERWIYNSLCNKLRDYGYVDATDDSYNNGKTKTLKFNFFFEDNANAEDIIKLMVHYAKLWTMRLGESVEPAKDKLINEFTDLSYEDYRDIVKEHLIRMGLQPDVANENIMSYAESIEENYNNEIDAVDTAQEVYDSNMDESCCCGGGKKKKDKKKGKKSDFVPFWAKKKDKVDEALEDDLDLEGMTLDEAITLDEGFGTAGGTPLSQLCADYIRDDYFTKLANEVGLEVAKAEFLEKAQEVTGDKYYKTLSARIQAAKTATAVLFVLQGTMFGGSNMDLAAGTRQSAYHRNRR